jgi:signal transduction histidine kinase
LFDHPWVKIHSKMEKDKFIMGYKSLFGRIFSNLIINAIQAGEDGVEISVSLSHIGENIRISFKDDGRGIPDDLKEKVFLPNFSTKSSGTGIGLAIARRGIEHCGGEISLKSEEGIGTEFLILLPKSD